jgi:hypothetical protein
MRFFGGGYSDIKRIDDDWVCYFDHLESREDLWAIGYREIDRHGVANLYETSCQLGRGIVERELAWLRWRWMQLRYKEMIGNCAYIFKPDTKLATEWWEELNVRMDWLLPELKLNPAKYPKERPGHIYEGVVSYYPVPWSFLLGDIFQPLVLKYKNRISFILPPPDFTNYQ